MRLPAAHEFAASWVRVRRPCLRRAQCPPPRAGSAPPARTHAHGRWGPAAEGASRRQRGVGGIGGGGRGGGAGVKAEQYPAAAAEGAATSAAPAPPRGGCAGRAAAGRCTRATEARWGAEFPRRGGERGVQPRRSAPRTRRWGRAAGAAPEEPAGRLGRKKFFLSLIISRGKRKAPDRFLKGGKGW